jgi:uncharacterized protein with HEPN domain
MPPERRIELPLVDIVDRADAIAEALTRLVGDDLAEDDPIRSSVLWSLTIIGEAVSRLPGDFRARHPDVEWGRITGFRNLVVHAYEQIAGSILEVTARERVPELRRQVEAILRAEYPLAAKAVDEHRRG